jgi:signal transduction histidine kinase
MLKPAGRAAARLLAAASKALVREMALIDEQGVVIAVNRAWRAAARRRDARRYTGLGEPYVDFCIRTSPALERPAFRHGVQALLSGRKSSFTHDYDVSEGARTRRRQVRITPSPCGLRSLFLVMHEDLSRATAREWASGARARELQSAREEERVRIAMELHDSTCQHLAALNLAVGRLKPLVSGDKAASVLDDMSISVGEVLKEIRVLAYLIKPPELEQSGLARAVQGYVNGFGVRTGLAVSFLTWGPVEAAPQQVQHAAYRIVQEALSNVYRHANARHADVELSSEGGVLTVRVSDNGRGGEAPLKGEPANFEPGVGIAGMRARATWLKGRVDIHGSEQGTVVVAAFPVGPRARPLCAAEDRPVPAPGRPA